MSHQGSPKLDLKLNLSPPSVDPRVKSTSQLAMVLPTSPPISCLSSEVNQGESSLWYSNSPEAVSMMLMGCPRCLMYVMLAEENLRCPKCKSTVLLDVVHGNTIVAAPANKKIRKD